MLDNSSGVRQALPPPAFEQPGAGTAGASATAEEDLQAKGDQWGAAFAGPASDDQDVNTRTMPALQQVVVGLQVALNDPEQAQALAKLGIDQDSVGALQAGLDNPAKFDSADWLKTFDSLSTLATPGAFEQARPEVVDVDLKYAEKKLDSVTRQEFDQRQGVASMIDTDVQKQAEGVGNGNKLATGLALVSDKEQFSMSQETVDAMEKAGIEPSDLGGGEKLNRLYVGEDPSTVKFSAKEMTEIGDKIKDLPLDKSENVQKQAQQVVKLEGQRDALSGDPSPAGGEPAATATGGGQGVEGADPKSAIQQFVESMFAKLDQKTADGDGPEKAVQAQPEQRQADAAGSDVATDRSGPGAAEEEVVSETDVQARNPQQASARQPAGGADIPQDMGERIMETLREAVDPGRSDQLVRGGMPSDEGMEPVRGGLQPVSDQAATPDRAVSGPLAEPAARQAQPIESFTDLEPPMTDDANVTNVTNITNVTNVTNVVDVDMTP